MPQLNTYLFFDGACAEAMRFYESVLGGKIEAMMTYADMPECKEMPVADRNRVMHARLALGNTVLMAADSNGDVHGKPDAQPKPFALTLTYASVDEARRIFETLAEGGQVAFPFRPAFFADGHGMVVDRFGTPWLINGGMRMG